MDKHRLHQEHVTRARWTSDEAPPIDGRDLRSWKLLAVATGEYVQSAVVRSAVVKMNPSGN